MIFRDFVSNCI